MRLSRTLSGESPTVTGRASILSGEAAAAANGVLHRRYGWQYNLIPLIKVPGIYSADNSLPLREKARRARMRSLWPDSAIVEVTLESAARTASESPAPNGPDQ